MNGFPVTIGGNGNLVKQYLTVAHQELNFTFIQVDKYTGIGSSLGHSLLKAEMHLQKPFIFHACDTIVKGNIPDLDHNWCGGYEKTNSSHYSTLNVEGEYLKTINPKGEVNYDLDYIGVSGIKDYKLFWKCLRKCYNENPDNFSLNDCDSIRLMLKQVKFKVHRFSSWNDIGNMKSLISTRSVFKSKHTVLDKEKEAIYFLNNCVVKFFSNSSINLKRIERALFLKNLTPKILNTTENFYSYEYVEGRLAASCIDRDWETKPFQSFSN